MITLLSIHSPTVNLHILEAKGCGMSSPVARTLATSMHTNTYLVLLFLGFMPEAEKAGLGNIGRKFLPTER